MNAYFNLRDYGTASWDGGDATCEHKAGPLASPKSTLVGYTGEHVKLAVGGMPYRDLCGKCGARRVDRQIGLEGSVTEYVDALVAVFREVRRVLRPDGVLFLVIADSYAGSWGNQGRKKGRGTQRPINGPMLTSVDDGRYPSRASGTGTIHDDGLKPKDLIGIPWEVAFALRRDGWWLRSDCIWAKPNPMPESVTDRPTKSHEYIFMFSKRANYYWDAEAVKEVSITNDARRPYTSNGAWELDGRPEAQRRGGQPRDTDASSRNIRSVWTIATQPFSAKGLGNGYVESDDDETDHFACVDDETEALTSDGWKRHDELTDGDWIATYNPVDHTLSWGKATIHRYDYDGEMVAVEKRDTSQRLTPNHRCLVRRRTGAIAIVRADELNSSNEIPTAAPWNYEGATSSRSIGTAWAELVGWYICEGYRRSEKQIHIYQSMNANPQHVDRIRGLLNQVRADFTERVRHREWRGRPSVEVVFVVSGNAAFQLQNLAPRKTLTPDLVNLPRDEAELLLEAIIAGDGHRRPDGRCTVFQKDRENVELMQALSIRMGYRSHLSQRNGGCFALYITKGEWLTLRGTNGVHGAIPTEHYTGVVWCPSVASGFWLARRNGKPFITGNSFPPDLVERCIKAGSSEKGACPACGAPWRRVVERGDLAGEAVIQQTERPAASVRDVSPSSLLRTNGRTWRESREIGWQPSCRCENAGDPIPCVILDPFSGSGTTCLVSERLGRDSIGIDLSPAYIELARKRIVGDAPLFATVAVE